MSECYDKLANIETQLKGITSALQSLTDKVDTLSIKVGEKESREEEVLEECKKMGAHIDFIETVYNNVKHPLGFLCNKIKYLAGTENTPYTLTDADTKLKVEEANE